MSILTGDIRIGGVAIPAEHASPFVMRLATNVQHYQKLVESNYELYGKWRKELEDENDKLKKQIADLKAEIRQLKGEATPAPVNYAEYGLDKFAEDCLAEPEETAEISLNDVIIYYREWKADKGKHIKTKPIKKNILIKWMSERYGMPLEGTSGKRYSATPV